MSGRPTTQAIIDGMRAALRRSGLLAATPSQPAPCSGDFRVDNFGVTYPNGELIINVQVTGLPAGATLVGATVVAVQSPGSGATYCMAVAAESAGLALPVSLLAASTSPVFSAPTKVTGTIVLAFMTDGALSQCVISQQFTVG
jgi:hypothetical protein